MSSSSTSTCLGDSPVSNDPNSLENEFHGAYNRPLYTDLFVAPRSPSCPGIWNPSPHRPVAPSRSVAGLLTSGSPISTLHAVSAMGTRLYFYHLDTTDVEPVITPLQVLQHSTGMDGTALMERWDCDVLDAVGEARLRAAADPIRAACANVANA